VCNRQVKLRNKIHRKAAQCLQESRFYVPRFIIVTVWYECRINVNIERSETITNNPFTEFCHSLVLLEGELLISGSRSLDDVNVHKISSVNVSLASRSKNVLDKLESLFTRPAKTFAFQSTLVLKKPGAHIHARFLTERPLASCLCFCNQLSYQGTAQPKPVLCLMRCT
jgi:hypothetical protein